ncbi:Uncharacterised protein [Mycobacteroides abscessus]|nr:Uncharacterised protein [Mycobacteroides abscessus]
MTSCSMSVESTSMTRSRTGALGGSGVTRGLLGLAVAGGAGLGAASGTCTTPVGEGVTRRPSPWGRP